MKKFIVIISCISLLLTLTACNTKNIASAPTSTTTSATSSTVASIESTVEQSNQEVSSETESQNQESSSEPEKEDTSSKAQSSSKESSSKAESSKKETVSKAKSSKKETSSKKTTSKKESSKKDTSSKTETVKDKNKTQSKTESAKKETSQKKKTTKKENTKGLSKFKYTVKDPNNKRGLSNKKYGYGFGIAENGKPHPMSIENQERFDGFKNVDALALDTKTDKKIMYLTFDNGYEYKNLTADILDTLKKKKVKAAFFITLSYAKNNKKLVQRMINEGHIVGNHTANHPTMPKLTRKQMAKEIADLDNYLRENFSYTSPYFRFPGGEHSENSLELVTSIGFKSVFWSIAYSDWDTSKQKGKKFAYETVTSRFHPGAVILLHAVSKDNAKALEKIIDKAHDEGYKFKTLDYYFK